MLHRTCLGLAVVAATTLTGCGGTDTQPPPPTTTSATPTSTTTTSQPTTTTETPRPTAAPPVSTPVDLSRHTGHACAILDDQQQAELGLRPAPTRTFLQRRSRTMDSACARGRILLGHTRAPTRTATARFPAAWNPVGRCSSREPSEACPRWFARERNSRSPARSSSAPATAQACPSRACTHLTIPACATEWSRWRSWSSTAYEGEDRHVAERSLRSETSLACRSEDLGHR
jgi:hypothetical protein